MVFLLLKCQSVFTFKVRAKHDATKTITGNFTSRLKLNNPLYTTSSKHRLVGHALKWKCHRKGGTHLLWRRRRDGLRRSLRWGAVQSKWVRPAGFFHFMSIPFKPEKAWRSRHKMKMPPKKVALIYFGGGGGIDFIDPEMGSCSK